MAKFEVKKVLRDKFTRIVFGPGEIRELTQERADEINKAVPGALKHYADGVAIEVDVAGVIEKEAPKHTTKAKTE